MESFLLWESGTDRLCVLLGRILCFRGENCGLGQETSTGSTESSARKRSAARVKGIGRRHNRIRSNSFRYRSAVARACYCLFDRAEMVGGSCAVAAVLAVRALFITLHHWAGHNAADAGEGEGLERMRGAGDLCHHIHPMRTDKFL